MLVSSRTRTTLQISSTNIECFRCCASFAATAPLALKVLTRSVDNRGIVRTEGLLADLLSLLNYILRGRRIHALIGHGEFEAFAKRVEAKIRRDNDAK